MNDNYFTVNQCLSSPGLAIVTGSSTLVKVGTAFTFKANGRISGTVSGVNATTLANATLLSPAPNGTPAAPGVLATGYSRVYALIATLPVTGSSTATPVLSWIAGNDFLTTTDLPSFSSFPQTNQANQSVVGWVVIANATGSNFTPGTTALDASNVTTTYVNNFAIVGE